eukprot:2893119-Ditylum_brightwellii.AAC.1
MNSLTSWSTEYQQAGVGTSCEPSKGKAKGGKPSKSKTAGKRKAKAQEVHKVGNKLDQKRQGVLQGLNAFVNAKVTAALNKVKKKQKKEKKVKINAFNKFCSLNVESSDDEGELKASTTATHDDSESKASCLLSDASNSKCSI